MTRRLLGLITARAGSKRFPGKNARPLAGASLIERAVHSALGARTIDSVGFSSDGQELRQLAAKAGLVETYGRPAILASDTATSADAVMDYVRWRAGRGDVFSHVVLLQPTSPLRTAAHIDAAVAQWLASGKDSLVSAVRMAPNGGYVLTRAPDGTLAQLDAGLDALVLDGAIYISPVEMIEEGRFWHADSEVFVTDLPRWFDIDVEEDFRTAELLLTARLP